MTAGRVENVISAQGNNLSDRINAEAASNQCPAVGLLAGLIAESNLNEQAERIGTWPDWSEGLGQQTVRYARVGDHTATLANLQVVRDYYWRADNAIREAARQYGAYYRQYQDHFEAWSRYNGGPSMAWADNPNKANIRRGWNAAQLYLAPDQEAPTMQYDADTSPEYQLQDWTCSVRTATWCLRALGFDVTAGDMQDRMQAAGLVSPQNGLEDGSGASLVRWLSATYGVTAVAVYPADWATVAGDAGAGPIAIGGQAWNHWVAVRRATPAGALDIMNPAPGWMGVGTILTPGNWARLGPFAAITIAVPAENGGDDLSAEERKELDDLRNYVGGLTKNVLPSALGTMEEAAQTGAQSRYKDARQLAAVVTGQCAAVRQAAGLETE